jgi:hypothetical protein
MQGNPHISNAEYIDRAPELRIIDSTLALAFEQRTANLIAAFGQLNYDAEEESFLGERLDGYEIAKQIQERLGLK